MGEVGEAYASARERITDIVRDGDAATRLTACPEWTVKDVVSHLTGICDDILNGRLDGVATEPWTAAQVDKRRELTMAEILDEWSKTAPQIEAAVDNFGAAGRQLIFDLVTHEQDLRTALGKPGARDSDGIGIAFGFITAGTSDLVKNEGLPTLLIQTPEDKVVLGEGAPEAVVRADRCEIVRMLSGRRTEDEMRALDWDGDPTPYLYLCERGPFTVPKESVGDRAREVRP